MCSLVWVTDTFVESKSLPRTDLGLKEKRSERWPSFREQGRRPEREEEEKTNSVAHDRELVLQSHEHNRDRISSRHLQTALRPYTNENQTHSPSLKCLSTISPTSSPSAIASRFGVMRYRLN
jgi:hypothetical protein